MIKFLVLAAFVLVVQFRGEIQQIISPAPDLSHVSQGQVVLYATSWCGYCAKTRKFFAARNIPYVEQDIEKSAEARKQYDQLGGRGVPVVVIAGNIIKGYNPESMEKHLDLL